MKKLVTAPVQGRSDIFYLPAGFFIFSPKFYRRVLGKYLSFAADFCKMF